MFRDINPKTMARAIEKYIRDGGAATRSATLELVARMLGFANYRALAAEDEKRPRKLLEKPMADWQARQTDDMQQRRYQLVIEEVGASQYRLLIAPPHVDPRKAQTMRSGHMLDMLIEINDGVPCVHVSNDPAGDVLVSVFATDEGLLVRPDAALAPAREAQGELARVVEANTSPRDGSVILRNSIAEAWALADATQSATV